MKGFGIIENVEPILNIDRIEGQVISIMVSIKTDPLKSVDIANRLSMIPEVSQSTNYYFSQALSYTDFPFSILRVTD